MRDAVRGKETPQTPTDSLDARLLLARSRHLGWLAIRAMVENEPGVRVVADEERVDRAVRRAAQLQPDAILMDAEPDESPAAATARRLRDHCPRSKLLVFGAEPDRRTELALAEIGVDGFVLWDDLTPQTLHYALGAALVGGLCVGSPAAVQELVAGPERRQRQRTFDIVFTDRERAVLAGLAEGLIEREIAARMGVGPRTVERIARELEDKFDVGSLLELRGKARDLGFGS